MNNRKAFVTSSLQNGVGLLTLAVAFSGCVPVPPATEPPESSLHFVPSTGDDANKIVQRWDPATQQLTTVVRSGVDIMSVGSQPKGSTLLYGSFSLVIGNPAGFINSVNPDDPAQGTHRIVNMGAGDSMVGWSADGQYLALVDESVLYVSTPTGTRTTVATVDANTKYSWSHSGDKLVYTKGADYSVHVYDVASGTNKLVYSATAQTPSVERHWHPDGQHLVVAHTDSTLGDIVYLKIDTNSADPVTATEMLRRPYTPLSGDMHIYLSPAADRFLISTETDDTGVFTYSMAFTDGRPEVTLGGADWRKLDTSPWSPSGNHVALPLWNGTAYEAIVANNDGQILRTHALPASAPAPQIYWSSADENLALVVDNTAQGSDVLTIDMPAGDWREIYSGTEGRVYESQKLQWSPDGRWLVFSPTSAATSYIYDILGAAPAPEPLDDNYLLVSWASNSKHMALCSMSGNDCQPSVLSVTPTGYTLTSIAVTTAPSMAWSVPGQGTSN